jgi:hypothetical protein
MMITWDVVMQPYLKSWEVLKCPRDTQSCRAPLSTMPGKVFFRSYGFAESSCWWLSPFTDTVPPTVKPTVSRYPQPAATVLGFDTTQYQFSPKFPRFGAGSACVTFSIPT